MRIYLCGPINGCTDEECRDWREWVKSQGVDTLDPMRRDYRGRETENYREIVELDKIDVASGCDVVLVNYTKPSVGTSMEMLYAWERGKPVILVCQKNASLSPWLRYHSHHICHSFRDALEWIAAL